METNKVDVLYRLEARISYTNKVLDDGDTLHGKVDEIARNQVAIMEALRLLLEEKK